MKRVFELITSLLAMSVWMTFLLWMTVFGCTEDFESFTDVTELRVLAIQSEPAELSPGDVGSLKALVYAPDDSVITYHWSWCPVATSSLTGHECPVTEEVLQNALIQSGNGVVSLPPELSLFDLGNGETAAFPFIIDAQLLQLACTQLVSTVGDQLPFLPDCEGTLSSSVKLEVSDGETDVVAVKELNLLLGGDVVPNQNPSMGTVMLEADDGETIFGGDAPPFLFEQTAYTVSVSLSPSVSEEFAAVSVETGESVVQRESLFMTWFITGGSTEFGRTSFVPGETDFDPLRINKWWTPRADETDGTATVYMVLQDERGGVNWIQQQVNLQER